MFCNTYVSVLYFYFLFCVYVSSMGCKTLTSCAGERLVGERAERASCAGERAKRANRAGGWGVNGLQPILLC